MLFHRSHVGFSWGWYALIFDSNLRRWVCFIYSYFVEYKIVKVNSLGYHIIYIHDIRSRHATKFFSGQGRFFRMRALQLTSFYPQHNKESPRRETFLSFFSRKCSWKRVSNEIFNQYMDTIRVSFPKISYFFNFQERKGNTGHFYREDTKLHDRFWSRLDVIIKMFLFYIL